MRTTDLLLDTSPLSTARPLRLVMFDGTEWTVRGFTLRAPVKDSEVAKGSVSSMQAWIAARPDAEQIEFLDMLDGGGGRFRVLVRQGVGHQTVGLWTWLTMQDSPQPS